MTLLIFSYLLAAFLFFFSYYLDSRGDRNTNQFTTITMASAFVTLFVAVAAHLLYLDNTSISVFVFRLALIILAFTLVSVHSFAYAVPYYGKITLPRVFGALMTVFAAYLVFSTGIWVEWGISGFRIHSNSFFGLAEGFTVFAYVFLLGLPLLTLVSIIMRAFTMKSRIYRQRLLFLALSLTAGLFSGWLLYQFSLYYYWALPLVPFSLAIFLILAQQAIQVSTLLDRTKSVASLVNFLLLGVVFSALAAAAVAALHQFIPVSPLSAVLVVLLAVGFLTLRESLARRLHRYVRVGSEYEAELEAGLDSIDFGAGGDTVIKSTVALLENHVEASTVEIMVADDRGRLSTVFSSLGSKNEIPPGNKAIEFLLGHTESIVLKTQAITLHAYEEIKSDLLKILDLSRADAFILLREGHKIIGLILLGPKKRGADYTAYDFSVLSRLYSNFFLVLYYLKNIANESVVLTVDREIEFSGQVISSIQENIDRVSHDKVDVDFVTRSARKLGGDFIDFIQLGPEKSLFVMGDVSGKGLNASMSMVILKSVLRTFLGETGDFKQLIVKVNSFIKNNLPKGTFFAGVFGLLDFKNNLMYYINCGVPAMFLYTSAYNNAIEIQGDGKILGFVRDIGKFLKVKKIALNPEDVILMTTDGLVDSTNLRGERFGKDRVQRMLMDNRGYQAGRIAKFLYESLSEFVSRELDDDITVLVIKYLKK